MDFAEQIRLLKQAGDDPEAVALVTLDIFLSSRDDELRRAIEAAVIPHWFDRDTLKTLLDEDQREKCEMWLETLKRCPMVEPFPARGAFCIHEATRLGLRKRLATRSPDRFRTLTSRAAASFPELNVRHQIEALFHHLVLDPVEAGNPLRQLEYTLRANPEDALALAVALEEYTDPAWPPLVRGWVYWLIATVREPYLSIPSAVKLSENAVACCSESDSPYAIAAAQQILGDLLLIRGQSGDADRALAQFEESLSIAQRLYEANPSSAQAARDVSVSRNKLGDFYLSRGQSGDADRALAQFEESLSIAQRLYEANPNSAQAARDVSISLDRLGDFYLSRGHSGDADRALAQFEESLSIDQRLYEANPNNAQAARDVSVSLNKLGDFYLSRGQSGDADRAFAQFEESLSIRQRLYEANSNSAQAARDVSVSLNKLGDFYLSRGQSGDADRAFAQFEESLSIRQRLYEANSNSAQAARDVSVSLNKLGDFYLSRGQSGDADRALAQFEESLSIDQRLYEANLNSAQAARDVSISLDRLGNVYLSRGQSGDADRALAQFEESLSIRQRLYEANPNSAQVVRDIVVSHFNLFRFGQRQQNDVLTIQHQTAFVELLQQSISSGIQFDPGIMRLYEQLRTEVGDQGHQESHRGDVEP